jgi:crotonobetainyl-CoA:carnitine CoA-transferase CaiB-like acyl-CoA transferase
MTDIERDVHFHERKVIVEVPDREMGMMPMHNISPRLSRTPGVFRGPAPRLGEHSEEVLIELGFSRSEVERLESDGVIRRAASGSEE